jgi:hypothetical protein
MDQEPWQYRVARWFEDHGFEVAFAAVPLLLSICAFLATDEVTNFICGEGKGGWLRMSAILTVFVLCGVQICLIVAFRHRTERMSKLREDNRRLHLENNELMAKREVRVIVAYIPFVFVMAGYVARDANNRNHSGLGWAVFYLAFQFLGLALVPSSGILWLFGSFVALVGAFVGLLFGWTGFVIYLIARRSGIPTTCRNCLNKRLPYFAVCPHCGLPSNSGENERKMPPSVQEATAFSSPS